jgi:hypothetical protein
MTRLWAGQSCVRIQLETRGYMFSKTSRLVWEPTSLPFNVYWGCFQGVKWMGREVDHSPPSSAKAKNGWSNISTPTVCLHGMDRVNCTFPFIVCFSCTGSLKTDHQKGIHWWVFILVVIKFDCTMRSFICPPRQILLGSWSQGGWHGWGHVTSM